MAHPRTFRFGIQLTEPLAESSWSDTAQRVESLGYSTLMVPDHFGGQLAPITAMAMAAAATTELRVGCLVFDNDYRHPVVLAKEMATLDALSGGRAEFGLGAGWMRSDYDESGIPFDAPRDRVDRFEEAVTVCRGLFTEERFTFDGAHYRLSEAQGMPRPATPAGPPLLIGGGGPRMLRFAGAHADIVGVNPSIHSGMVDAAAARDAAADRFDAKVGWVREGAGSRFDDIELNVLVFLAQITDDAASVAEMMAPMFGVDTETFAATPAVVCGTVDEICATLHQRRDRWGVSYIVFQGPEALEAMAPVVARLNGE